MGRTGSGDASLPPSNEQDLYEPTKPESQNVNHQPRSPHAPSNEEAQSFPPPPPHQPRSPHAPSNEEAQSFPPPPPHQGQYHDPNNKPPQAFHPASPPQFQQRQPANNAGVQMGQPLSSPLNINPGAQVLNQLPTQHWNSGLFDCMNDPENAIITAFLPCVTFGQNAEIVDLGVTPCGTSGMMYGFAYIVVIPFMMSCTYRTKLRSRFGLYETPAPDWLVHLCCNWCALCQEFRELKARDLDPSIGWIGNVAKRQRQNQPVAMAAPGQQRMI